MCTLDLYSKLWEVSYRIRTTDVCDEEIGESRRSSARRGDEGCTETDFDRETHRDPADAATHFQASVKSSHYRKMINSTFYVVLTFRS